MVYLLEFRRRGAKFPLMDNDTRWNSTYLMVCLYSIFLSPYSYSIREIVHTICQTDVFNFFYIFTQLKRLLEIKEIIVGLAEKDMDLFLSKTEWKQLMKLENVLRHP